MSVPPTFATHNGANPVTAVDFGVLQGSIVDRSGLDALTVGWFGVHQTVPWVFSQAPWTNDAVRTGAPDRRHRSATVPRRSTCSNPGSTNCRSHGVDFWMKANLATHRTVERGPAGAGVRAGPRQRGSVVIDHGDGLSYSAELTHLSTSGPDTARVLFGTQLVGDRRHPALDRVRPAHDGLRRRRDVPVGTSARRSSATAYSCYRRDGAAVTTSTLHGGQLLLRQGASRLQQVRPGVRRRALRSGVTRRRSSTTARSKTCGRIRPRGPSRGCAAATSWSITTQVGANRQGFRVSTDVHRRGRRSALRVRAVLADSAARRQFGVHAGLRRAVLPAAVRRLGHARYRAALRRLVQLSRNRFANLTLDLEPGERSWRAGAGRARRKTTWRCSIRSVVFTLLAEFRPEGLRRRRRGAASRSTAQFDTSAARTTRTSGQNLVFAGARIPAQRQHRLRRAVAPVLDRRLADDSGRACRPLFTVRRFSSTSASRPSEARASRARGRVGAAGILQRFRNPARRAGFRASGGRA